MSTFKKADVLLPKNTEYMKWSVVACDQYTSQPDYWNEVGAIAEGSPSAYHIIFPEIYLGKNDDERIANINETMRDYLERFLYELPETYIYVERTLANGKVRRGIVGAVDLEDYDFGKGSQSLIRATEGTVLERIPPRVKIRENALLEIPHVMLLIDDEKKQVIEPLAKQTKKLEKVYDFDLMQNSGHLKGMKVSGELSEKIDKTLLKLADEKSFAKRYNVKDKGVLLFAVGDGNHSLAAAKACWENIKKDLTDEEIENHPARFALVEIVNLHDESLEFEPIHRVVFGADPEKLIAAFMKYYKGKAAKRNNGGQCIEYMYKGKIGKLYVKDAPSNLAAGTLQQFLDDYMSANSGCTVDYIHGADVVKELSSKDNNTGFILPAMEKNDLFKTVILDGALPRKTFSMGEAQDKRFYLEAKRIK